MWPIFFSVLSVTVVAIPHFLLYFSSLTESLDQAIWAAVLITVFALGVMSAPVVGSYHKFGFAYLWMNMTVLFAVLSASLYLLLSFVAKLGPFADFDLVTGRERSQQKHWTHCIWLFCVCFLFLVWGLPIVGHFNIRYRNFRNNTLKVSFCQGFLTMVLFVPLQLTLLAGVISVTYAVTYYAQQASPTFANKFLELIIVGLAWPMFRVYMRAKLINNIIAAVGRDLSEQTTKQDNQRVLMELTGTLEFFMGIGNVILLSLVGSWASYFLAHASEFLTETITEYLMIRQGVQGGLGQSVVGVLRKSLRFKKAVVNPNGVDLVNNSPQNLAEKLEIQSCRLYAVDESQKIMAFVSPVVAGFQMMVVMKIVGEESVNFIGWPSLLLRAPLNLLFESLTDYSKLVILNRIYDVQPSKVVREHYAWDKLGLSFSALYGYGASLGGMLLVQMWGFEKKLLFLD